MCLCRRSLAQTLALLIAAHAAPTPSTSFAARPGSAPGASASSKPALVRGLVIVLRPNDLNETMRVVLARITGELAAASFQVRVEPLDLEKDLAPQIEGAVLASEAVAAFAIEGSREGLAIWTFERARRRAMVRRMPVRRGNVAQEAKVVALKAVEVIRANLAELMPPARSAASPVAASPPPPVPATLPTSPAPAPSAPPAPPPPIHEAPPAPASPPPAAPAPAPPPAPPAAPPPSPSLPPTPPSPPAPPESDSPPPPSPGSPREEAAAGEIESIARRPEAIAPPSPPWKRPPLTVGLGVASLWDIQAAPQWMGALHLEARTWTRFALQMRVAGLGPSLTVSAAEGSASIQRERISLGAAWFFFSVARLELSLTAAIGAEHVSATGTAVDPTRPTHTEAGWLPLGLLGLGAALRLTPHLSLSARVEGDWATYDLDLGIGDARTMPLSRPGLLGELGVQATF